MKVKLSMVASMTKPPKSRVQEIRLARGMSSAELAEMAGIQAPTISKVDLGQRNVTKNTAPKLAKALRVEIPDLYAAPGSPVPPVEPRPASRSPAPISLQEAPESLRLKEDQLKAVLIDIIGLFDGPRELGEAVDALWKIARQSRGEA